MSPPVDEVINTLLEHDPGCSLLVWLRFSAVRQSLARIDHISSRSLISRLQLLDPVIKDGAMEVKEAKTALNHICCVRQSFADYLWIVFIFIFNVRSALEMTSNTMSCFAVCKIAPNGLGDLFEYKAMILWWTPQMAAPIVSLFRTSPPLERLYLTSQVRANQVVYIVRTALREVSGSLRSNFMAHCFSRLGSLG